MKTIKIIHQQSSNIKPIISSIALVFVMMFLSLNAFSSPHVTMGLKNITTTNNTIEYDLYLLNDGTKPLKISAYSFGVNYNSDILNHGQVTYSLVPQTRTSSLPLTVYSLDATNKENNYQARMTSTPLRYQQATLLVVNESITIGRFRMSNDQHWTANSKAAFALQETLQIGLTTTQLVAYIDTDTKLVALTPRLKTVSTLVEETTVLNPSTTNGNIKVEEQEQPATTKLSSKVQAYPNPTSDIIHLQYKADKANTEVLINIKDAQGKVVKQILTHAIEGSNKVDISLAELANGIYVAEIIKGKQANEYLKIEKVQ